MTMIQRFDRIQTVKFSFAKSNGYSRAFALDCGASSMYDPGFGLGIPSNLSAENQLRAIFSEVLSRNGIFLFNISGVDLKQSLKGFSSYDEADYNNQITEWELFMILNNRDYLKRCNFHNGKVQFKKRMIWNSIM